MSDAETPEEVFADTCVLLNFIQQEWEHDRATELVTSDVITIIVSETVIEELTEVSDRRRDIYEDIVDYFYESENDIEEYDPSERRVYVGINDASHIRDIQMDLSRVDDRREVMRRLRHFVRAANRRLEHVEQRLADNVSTAVPPLSVQFAINGILHHGADARVVSDASAWASEEESGVLVSLDGDDILENSEEINDCLSEKRGENWELRIVPPDEITAERATTESGD